MIEFYHVNKIYPPGIYALKDVTFKVDKGEFVYITGPSGAGKSTLLSIIYLATRPSSGKVIIRNRDITKIRGKEVSRFRREIGIVFQDFKLLADRTIFENIAIPLLISNFPRSHIEQRVKYLLNFVGLYSKRWAYPDELSGGEQQRVAIARAIANDPYILLADEPTGNLDEAMAIEILYLLREINLKGITILLATHSKEIMKLFPGNRLHLENGMITDEKVEILD